jgi:hypothetical protein
MMMSDVVVTFLVMLVMFFVECGEQEKICRLMGEANKKHHLGLVPIWCRKIYLCSIISGIIEPKTLYFWTYRN